MIAEWDAKPGAPGAVGSAVARRTLLASLALGLCACAAPGADGDRQANAGRLTATAATSAALDDGLGPDLPTTPDEPGTATSPRPTPPLPSRQTISQRYAGSRPHAWGLEAPGTVTDLGPAGVARHAVALTFDACGGARPTEAGCGVDEQLLATLRRLQVPATLFLNARWIAAHQEVTHALVADPLFTIANHGTRHVPLSVTGARAYGVAGTASAAEAYDEIAANQEVLTRLTGTPPKWFRPGTAYCDEVGVQIARDLGLSVAGFTVNGDHGATLAAGGVARQVASVAPGQIVLAHMNRPGSGTAAGVAAALPGLLARGVHFVRLGDPLT